MIDREELFHLVLQTTLPALRPNEHLTIELIAEDSHFIRFNHARVRQNGFVSDGNIKLTLMKDQRELSVSFPLTEDKQKTIDVLTFLQTKIDEIPPNPYAVPPQGSESSRSVYGGTLLDPDRAVEEILTGVQDLDFVGLYGGGRVIRASANSRGACHWFATENFTIDYSIYQGERAVKGIYSDRIWDQQTYATKIQQDRLSLDLLNQAPYALDRGSYRVYLAPRAVAALVEMLEGEVGAGELHQKTSALVPLWEGRQQLSPYFELQENFQSGLVPPFNEYGQLAPPTLPLITGGKLVNMLVNDRSGAEYHLPPNGANRYESMRAAEVSPGNLPPDQVLACLDRGIYLSDLHYLNWSDRATGRITGMTRFACFWVEGGRAIAPIPAMRFDDSLYSFLGENLEAVTTTREFIPETSTYDHRSIGGRLVPGMIVNAFKLTI